MLAKEKETAILLAVLAFVVVALILRMYVLTLPNNAKVTYNDSERSDLTSLVEALR